MAVPAETEDMYVARGAKVEVMMGVWHCSNCDFPLGVVMADEERTYLSAGTQLHVRIRARKAGVDCPDCGEVQQFHSRPLSAVRLGIGED